VEETATHEIAADPSQNNKSDFWLFRLIGISEESKKHLEHAATNRPIQCT
jgi:hypothetical protein